MTIDPPTICRHCGQVPQRVVGIDHPPGSFMAVAGVVCRCGLQIDREFRAAAREGQLFRSKPAGYFRLATGKFEAIP